MNESIRINGLCPLLNVFDMPESLKFYRDKLGFKVIGSSGEGDDVGWCWLRLNGTEIMLNTIYDKEDRPLQKDMSRQTAHIDTAIYFGCPDINSTYKFLLNKAVDIKPPIKTGYNFMALYVSDPDGYQLVFHWPVKEEIK